MSVKTIFKVLIGTVFLMAVISLTLEMYNINTTGLQLGSIGKMSLKQACVFFGQETYKRDDIASINMDNLYTSEGTEGISGVFYQGTTLENIYNNLYGAGSAFRQSHGPVESVLRGNWNTLDDLLNGTAAGKQYKQLMMTPLNMGIPYLDEECVEKIFRWNLANILNNGQTEADGRLTNMKVNSEGRIYVEYKGFQVFAGEAEIADIEYRVLNLDTDGGRQDFKKYTNMNADIILNNTSGYGDERRKVCLAGVSYTVPMKYEGITPLRHIMESAWNYKVEGMQNHTRSGSLGTGWNPDSESLLSQGGFDGYREPGVLPVPGEFVYYIIR